MLVPRDASASGWSLDWNQWRELPGVPVSLQAGGINTLPDRTVAEHNSDMLGVWGQGARICLPFSNWRWQELQWFSIVS